MRRVPEPTSADSQALRKYEAFRLFVAAVSSLYLPKLYAKLYVIVLPKLTIFIVERLGFRDDGFTVEYLFRGRLAIFLVSVK